MIMMRMAMGMMMIEVAVVGMPSVWWKQSHVEAHLAGAAVEAAAGRMTNEGQVVIGGAGGGCMAPLHNT